MPSEEEKIINSDYCPQDCNGELCEDCMIDDEPDFPSGSVEGYYPY